VHEPLTTQISEPIDAKSKIPLPRKYNPKLKSKSQTLNQKPKQQKNTLTHHHKFIQTPYTPMQKASRFTKGLQ